MEDAILTITKQSLTFAVMNSLIIFGILNTIKRVVDKEEMHRFVGLGITYGVGIIMGFLLGSVGPVWQKIVYGIFIGSCTVAVYKSATQSIMEIIPKIINKFLG